MAAEKKLKIVKKMNALAALFRRFSAQKKHFNEEMEGKYSPSFIALIAAFGAAILMILMLFVPNYLGVGDDGSFYRLMEAAGLSYVSDTVLEESSEFFNRVYLIDTSKYVLGTEMLNSQVLIVKAAVKLDRLLTGDNYFDIRMLALIYGILYIPAIYLLIRQACMRVKCFSEGIVIGLLGVLFFSDVAYITYFNSLYPESVWFISLLYCVAGAVSFQEKRSLLKEGGSLFLIAGSGIVLMTSRAQCAFIGIILALYCLKLLFTRKEWSFSVVCVLTSLGLSIISIAAMAGMESDFNQTDKFHAMSRGVLFGSNDPAETLKEFGIEPSFELLADVSAYDPIPLVKVEEEIISDNFLNKYSVSDIGRYYIRHPEKFVRMIDISIKSCFGIRRDQCGNYEKSVGLPEGAKSPFWSLFSTFKNSAAPKTIGWLIVLIIAACLLFGKEYSLRPLEDKRSTVLLDSIAVLLLVCVSQAGVTIVNSGDAAMIRHCFLVSASMDIMTYFVFAQIAHRLNIF